MIPERPGRKVSGIHVPAPAGRVRCPTELGPSRSHPGLTSWRKRTGGERGAGRREAGRPVPIGSAARRRADGTRFRIAPPRLDGGDRPPGGRQGDTPEMGAGFSGRSEACSREDRHRQIIRTYVRWRRAIGAMASVPNRLRSIRPKRTADRSGSTFMARVVAGPGPATAGPRSPQWANGSAGNTASISSRRKSGRSRIGARSGSVCNVGS